MPSRTGRRQFLAAAAAASGVGVLTGCTTSGANVGVHNRDCVKGIMGVGARCKATVENTGLSGSVRITFIFVDEHERVVDSISTIEYLPSGEVIEVEVTGNIPSEATGSKIEFESP